LPKNLNRPKGITIIAVLFLVSGIALLFSQDPINMIFGIVSIVAFYGLKKGRGWAWSTAIDLCILNIGFQVVLWVGSFFSISTDSNSFLMESIKLIVETTIDIALVYYLYRHNAKVFFGKAVDVAQTSS
jgi:hypothetical protein